jgi:serine phosphatase RsbU (regulator of sigma subunit)
VFERRRSPRTAPTVATIGTIQSDASALDRAIAADVLLRHLFVPPAQPVAGIRYAAYYRFAAKHSGGDVIDVYRCTDGDVHLSLTDISGKGVMAALHAGLVKYGVRAYATEGHEPRNVLRWLNRFYGASDTFERADSFASVFVARYTPKTRMLRYASAGHEGLVLFQSGADPIVLNPTGPVVGVMADTVATYTDERIRVTPEATLVAVSDGVTEARHDGILFGMDRLIGTVARLRNGSLEDVACGIAREAGQFELNRVIDDMAVLVVRFVS